MAFGSRARTGSGAVVAVALLAAASGAWAAQAEPRRDDTCTTQCDEASDKCMIAAGRDKEKQKTCDAAYEECLRKCT